MTMMMKVARKRQQSITTKTINNNMTSPNKRISSINKLLCCRETSHKPNDVGANDDRADYAYLS
jgi:hypothetical protein